MSFNHFYEAWPVRQVDADAKRMADFVLLHFELNVWVVLRQLGKVQVAMRVDEHGCVKLVKSLNGRSMRQIDPRPHVQIILVSGDAGRYGVDH